jgi:hypothetical protein
MRYALLVVSLLSLGTAVGAEEAKTLSGMSVLGNNEAPKSLVIVPWKSSQIGDGIGVIESLSNRPVPIDREVFQRELHYYEIRTGSPEPIEARRSAVSVSGR